jgi:hypothetical protein
MASTPQYQKVLDFHKRMHILSWLPQCLKVKRDQLLLQLNNPQAKDKRLKNQKLRSDLIEKMNNSYF